MRGTAARARMRMRASGLAGLPGFGVRGVGLQVTWDAGYDSASEGSQRPWRRRASPRIPVTANPMSRQPGSRRFVTPTVREGTGRRGGAMACISAPPAHRQVSGSAGYRDAGYCGASADDPRAKSSPWCRRTAPRIPVTRQLANLKSANPVTANPLTRNPGSTNGERSILDPSITVTRVRVGPFDTPPFATDSSGINKLRREGNLAARLP
jgi:hypothetical protein